MLDKMAVGLARKYSFAIAPSKIEELTAEKIVFAQGNFQNHRIDQLEIFSDGIVVSAKSPSNVIDAFIIELLAWANDEFGLKRIETHVSSKTYESHLIVHSQKKLLSIMDGLKGVQNSLRKMLNASTKIDVEMEHFGFSIAADLTKIAGLKPIAFRLERKADASFGSNIYYSSAPLRTSDHLKVLEQIEALV